MPAPLGEWQPAQAGTPRSGMPPRQMAWPRSMVFSLVAEAAVSGFSFWLGRYRATLRMSSSVRGAAMGAMTEGAPAGPLRVGPCSPVGLKSTSCLTRYSYGWPARLGFIGIMLLPASPWQLAQAITPRAASPLTYSCSPLAASGFAAASAA